MNNIKISSLSVDEFTDLVVNLIRDTPKEYFVEEVRKVVHELIGDDHPDQHQFITMLMDERKDRLERRKAIQDKIAGSLILSMIVGLVALLGAGALDWLRVALSKAH